MSLPRIFASLLGSALTLCALAACEQPCDNCGLTETEWDLVQGLTPLPDPPIDPTNRYQLNPMAIEFGRMILFDARYSGAIKISNSGGNGGLGDVGDSGKISCIACHDPENYFVDTRSRPNNVSLAAAFTPRNAPSLVNLVYYEWWGWGGRHDSMWQQASLAIETPTDTASDRCVFAHFVAANYEEAYNATFEEQLPDALTSSNATSRIPDECRPKAEGAPDGNWERMSEDDRHAVMQILANQGKAVAAFEAQLISRNAPFDRWVAGEKNALTPAQLLGLRLFVGKAACVDCHFGPFFTDQKFHNLGVPQEGQNIPAQDLGRTFDLAIYRAHPFNSASPFNDAPERNRTTEAEEVISADAAVGAFRTQSLRNVARTAPYMHTGGFQTLTEVVEFYNDGGSSSGYSGIKSPRIKPLNLTREEMDALVAFLESLTGEPLPPQFTVNPHTPSMP